MSNVSSTILGAKKSTQTLFVQSFSTTLWVMDVRAENRGHPHQKVRFPAAPMVGRNFLTPGHPGVRVRNVRRKSGPKSLGLCCFFFPEICQEVLVHLLGHGHKHTCLPWRCKARTHFQSQVPRDISAPRPCRRII